MIQFSFNSKDILLHLSNIYDTSGTSPGFARWFFERFFYQKDEKIFSKFRKTALDYSIQVFEI